MTVKTKVIQMSRSSECQGQSLKLHWKGCIQWPMKMST